MKQTALALLLVSLTTFSAFAQKKQSDREFEGFRGQVKSVTLKEAELKQSGTAEIEAALQPQKMLTFDTNGNLVSDKAYNRGEEFDERTYSFIDGEWVVKHEILTKNVLTMGKKPGQPRDMRFSARMKYKHDNQGNRTEMHWLTGDGRLSLKYVYKRESNRNEVMVYLPDGSLSHGYIEKLDDKGNEVEITDVVPNYPPRPKTFYTYLEFDSQGNWIKRRKTRGESSSINYRTITYH